MCVCVRDTRPDGGIDMEKDMESVLCTCIDAAVSNQKEKDGGVCVHLLLQIKKKLAQCVCNCVR